jgi:hypothetical protein
MTKPVDSGPAGFADTEEDEDTIELELSAEQLLALSQAAAASEPSAPTLQPVTQTKAPAVNSQIKGRRLGARHAAILAEVFEFPPGTSELEARDAVAEVLLQRARDRQGSWQKVTHARQQAEDKNRPAAATKLAQRGG